MGECLGKVRGGMGGREAEKVGFFPFFSFLFFGGFLLLGGWVGWGEGSTWGMNG